MIFMLIFYSYVCLFSRQKLTVFSLSHDKRKTSGFRKPLNQRNLLTTLILSLERLPLQVLHSSSTFCLGF